MGKIVAIGGGFDGAYWQNLVEHIMALSGKEHPHVLSIPTASFDNTDRGVMETFFNTGCTVDALYLTYGALTEKMIEEKIAKADIVFVSGGNLKFLIDTWRETKTDVYLKRAYEKGTVLCGSSSGSMCWFKEGYDDCGRAHEFMFYEALGLLPYVNSPHFESGNWGSFEDAVKSRSLSGIALENDCALCFVDGKKYILNGENDSRAFFFDKNDGFKKINLKENKEVLAAL